jgi:hypothetical protein
MPNGDARRFVWLAAALLAVTTVPATACLATTPLVPSAVIVPDIIEVPVGSTQVFTVYYGTVLKFTIQAGKTGSGCLAVDPSFDAVNSVRVIATRTCGGMAYMSADIGSGRTPLISAISVVEP